MPSHIVVVLVVKDIAHEQNDGLVAVVLPPMRGAARLRPDLAGFMHDRIGAVAGVFDDLPLGDVDDRGTIGVAGARTVRPALLSWQILLARCCGGDRVYGFHDQFQAAVPQL